LLDAFFRVAFLRAAIPLIPLSNGRFQRTNRIRPNRSQPARIGSEKYAEIDHVQSSDVYFFDALQTEPSSLERATSALTRCGGWTGAQGGLSLPLSGPGRGFAALREGVQGGMLEQVALTLLGLVLLLGGGEALVRGSCALAETFGVSPRVIGITLVAFGTSAPELAVNVAAARQGHPEMCFGNVIGSNLANVGLIVGVAALLRPLSVHRLLVLRDLPIMLAVTFAACLMGAWPLDQSAEASFSRFEGLLLLLGFAAFMGYVARAIRSERDASGTAPDMDAGTSTNSSTGQSAALGLAGLLGLLLGARWTVQGATELAAGFGVSDAVIGLTLLAVGTSLPELATSVIATLRGQVDLAVGNVVGSNLFNLLLVLGASSQFGAIPIPTGGQMDLWVSLLISVALLIAAITQGRQVVRYEGGLLLGAYLLYLIGRVSVV